MRIKIIYKTQRHRWHSSDDNDKISYIDWTWCRNSQCYICSEANSNERWTLLQNFNFSCSCRLRHAICIVLSVTMNSTISCLERSQSYYALIVNVSRYLWYIFGLVVILLLSDVPLSILQNCIPLLQCKLSFWLFLHVYPKTHSAVSIMFTLFFRWTDRFLVVVLGLPAEPRLWQLTALCSDISNSIWERLQLLPICPQNLRLIAVVL